jgi:hypothetical protein
VNVGRAANPPTAATTQSLTATPRALGARAGKKKPKKVSVGKGKTTVRPGKTATIKVTLTRSARSRLRRGHRIKATLKVTARGATGTKASVTRTITLKPKPRKRRR